MMREFVFKDGRREPVPQSNQGSIRIYRTTRGANGEYLETVFTIQEPEPDVLEWHEGETQDVTDSYAKAARDIEARTMAVLKRGLGLS